MALRVTIRSSDYTWFDWANLYQTAVDLLTGGFFSDIGGAAGESPSAPRGTRPSPDPNLERADDWFVGVPDIIAGPPAPAPAPPGTIGLAPTFPVDIPTEPVWRPPTTTPQSPLPPSTSPSPLPSSPSPSTSPATRPGAPRPRSPVSVPGLLIDEWLELWRQYLNPRPIPWPSRRERGTPRVPPSTIEFPNEQPDLENICASYPELCTVTPRSIPGTIFPSPVDDPSIAAPTNWPSNWPFPATPSAPSPAGYPYGVPLPYDPFSTTPGPVRAPASPRPATRVPRRTTPSEPAFPWPSDLLPRTGRRNRPAPSPLTRTPSQPAPRSPTAPGSPLIVQQPYNPLVDDPTRATAPQPSSPLVPSNPCTAAATEQKREQRRRRKECKRFKTKTIRVCADKR